MAVSLPLCISLSISLHLSPSLSLSFSPFLSFSLRLSLQITFHLYCPQHVTRTSCTAAQTRAQPPALAPVSDFHLDHAQVPARPFVLSDYLRGTLIRPVQIEDVCFDRLNRRLLSSAQPRVPLRRPQGQQGLTDARRGGGGQE